MTTDELLAAIRAEAGFANWVWNQAEALAVAAESDDVEGYDELRDGAIFAQIRALKLFSKLDALLTTGDGPLPVGWRRP